MLQPATIVVVSVTSTICLCAAFVLVGGAIWHLCWRRRQRGQQREGRAGNGGGGVRQNPKSEGEEPHSRTLLPKGGHLPRSSSLDETTATNTQSLSEAGGYKNTLSPPKLSPQLAGDQCVVPPFLRPTFNPLAVQRDLDTCTYTHTDSDDYQVRTRAALGPGLTRSQDPVTSLGGDPSQVREELRCDTYDTNETEDRSSMTVLSHQPLYPHAPPPYYAHTHPHTHTHQHPHRQQDQYQPDIGVRSEARVGPSYPPSLGGSSSSNQSGTYPSHQPTPHYPPQQAVPANYDTAMVAKFLLEALSAANPQQQPPGPRAAREGRRAKRKCHKDHRHAHRKHSNEGGRSQEFRNFMSPAGSGFDPSDYSGDEGRWASGNHAGSAVRAGPALAQTLDSNYVMMPLRRMELPTERPMADVPTLEPHPELVSVCVGPSPPVSPEPPAAATPPPQIQGPTTEPATEPAKEKQPPKAEQKPKPKSKKGRSSAGGDVVPSSSVPLEFFSDSVPVSHPRKKGEEGKPRTVSVTVNGETHEEIVADSSTLTAIPTLNARAQSFNGHIVARKAKPQPSLGSSSTEPPAHSTQKPVRNHSAGNLKMPKPKDPKRPKRARPD